MAIDYEHSCRACGLTWVETYNLSDTPPDSCPKCASEDVYRHVGSSGFVLKGSGWASDGYYQFGAYDRIKAKGQEVTRYERKEDLDRVLVGEAVEKEKKNLKRLDEVAKKTLGYKHRVTEAQAEKKLAKAKEEALK